ncbi:hypothetical protein PY793_14110, partial [Acetobacter fabarum]
KGLGGMPPRPLSSHQPQAIKNGNSPFEWIQKGGHVNAIDAQKIKGLGPAVANLLYFLHPTIMPPFNTAIVNGYNSLTGSKVKLGRWEEYLAMRQGILKLNATYRSLLSNDLGAIGGLLFDLGSGRYSAPPLEDDETARKLWEADLHQVREQSAKEARVFAAERETDHTHTEIQGWLRDLGSGPINLLN